MYSYLALTLHGLLWSVRQLNFCKGIETMGMQFVFGIPGVFQGSHTFINDLDLGIHFKTRKSISIRLRNERKR